MSEDFELRLVRVHWNSKNQFAYLDEISQHPIRIKKQKDRHFTAEIPSYPRLEDNIACQLALQCNATLSQEIPRIKREENTIAFFPISDHKHGSWWIEKGAWKKRGKFKYHDAPSCRHAGEFTILVGDMTIHLNIIPSGFTPLEYHDLLSSFKGELWQLILDKDSTTTISKDGEGKLPGEEFQKQVSKFIKFADQILAKPTEELRERQEIQRIEKVRPTARTFMELSAKGSSVKFVTGRGYEPSYNTPENKYIADIINRLILIVRNLRNGVEYSKDSLDRSIKVIEKHLSQSQRDFIEVDPAKLDAEIAQEERRKQRWEQKRDECEKYFSHIGISGKHKKEIFPFTIQGYPRRYGRYIYVWVKYKNPDEPKEGYLVKIPHEASGDSFWLKSAQCRLSNVSFNYKYEKNKKRHEVTIVKASTVEFVENPIDKIIVILKSERQLYKGKNWKKQLTRQEKNEKKRELLGLKKRGDMLSSMAKKYEEKLEILTAIYKDLLAFSKKCKSLKITVENRLDYPGTMTFVQNPSYRGAYSSYKKIQNESKFETLFDDLLTIQEFGITDQPNIYEKWCLLQIINVLENYGFIQGEGWETKLVSSISRKKYATCSFIFTHTLLSQEIELIYQPELKNRKTPDFMLKIKSKTGEMRLVLDAKNKAYDQVFAKYNTFSDDLNNLVNKKDYSESGENPVFILHPMKEKGVLPVIPTPQSWSSCSILGGSSVFDWEAEKDFAPEHMYGGAQVRPEDLDNLKMVIALSLQYLTEDNRGVYNNKKPKNYHFCIICGGTKFNTNKKCDTKGKHYTCTKCQHFFVEHYCSCGNRLWKHGSYWTYHDTRSTEPYNIKCPRCGDFYTEDKEKQNEVQSVH